MKRKISISVEEEILERIKLRLESGLFRSQSHLIEYATRKLLDSGVEK